MSHTVIAYSCVKSVSSFNDLIPLLPIRSMNTASTSIHGQLRTQSRTALYEGCTVHTHTQAHTLDIYIYIYIYT